MWSEHEHQENKKYNLSAEFWILNCSTERAQDFSKIFLVV